MGSVLEYIEEHFRANYENFPDEFYPWGDFSGDRTLDLKIAKPTVLTARLLADLQKYLQKNVSVLPTALRTMAAV